MAWPWRLQDTIQKRRRIGFFNKFSIPLKHYLIKLSAPEKSWVMLSTSFSALCGCPRNTNWTRICVVLHLISMCSSLIPWHCPPLWHVCWVPAAPPHLPSIITAETICSLFTQDSVPAGQLLSLLSLLFSFRWVLFMPTSFLFVNLLNSLSQWLFQTSATGCNFLQLPLQSALSQTPAKTVLVLFGFIFSANLCTASSAFPVTLLFIFCPILHFDFDGRTVNNRLFVQWSHLKQASYSWCSGFPQQQPAEIKLQKGSPPGAKPVEGLHLKV